MARQLLSAFGMRHKNTKSAWWTIGSPEILAAMVAVFLAVSSAMAGDVVMKSGPNFVEIGGGSGTSAWRLTYGNPRVMRIPQDLVVSGDVAYFSHGPFLRQIDTRRGLVTGRWIFPWEIAHITPEGAKVRVEIAHSNDLAHSFRETVLLDPANPRIPNWPFVGFPWLVQGFLPLNLAETEATAPWNLGLTPTMCGPGSAAPNHLAMDELTEMVRRDPLSPYFRVALGCLKAAIGDSSAAGLLQDAVHLPSADYWELFHIAALLPQKDLARQAYETGYRQYLDRGFDPRLNRQYNLYPASTAVKDGPDAMDLIYRLTPYGRLQWKEYARYWGEHGDASWARLWKVRAEDPVWKARAEDPRAVNLLLQLGYNDSRLWITTYLVIMSWVFLLAYLIVVYWRYRPQRSQDRATNTGWTCKPFVTLFHLEYSDHRERAAALALLLAPWLAFGCLAVLQEHFVVSDGLPLRGSLAGPETAWYLENRLPPSKQRDLLMALSYQQSGQNDKAERLYRQLPEFAEGWNNLGVLLQSQGKAAEARSAFESALKADPQLTEAELNLRGGAKDLWTSQYKRLFPGRPMLAFPGGDTIETALAGRPPWQSYLRMMGGALIPATYQEVVGPGAFLNDVRSFFLGMLSLVIALLLVAPRVRVSAAPGVGSRVADILLPGSARAWLRFGGVLSGITMSAWWCLLGASSRFIPGVRFSGSERVFLASAAVLLFAANLLLVIRSWKRPTPAT
jgi:tetratricopeptide (TPR) repeat protein